jgi:hypothetical protein
LDEFELLFFIKHLGLLLEEYVTCELTDVKAVILSEIQFFGEILRSC